MKVLALVVAWFSLLCGVHASQQLEANALVPCEGMTSITTTNFSVQFDRASKKITYDASVNVNFGGYVYAVVELWVYGLRVLNTTLDPCTSSGLIQLCPLSAGKIEIQGDTHLGESITKHIPGIAYTVPDIDAYAIVKIRDRTKADFGKLVACLRIEASNKKSVEQTSVKWVTACIAGAFLLLSSVMTYFSSSATAQHVGAASFLMFSYFQSMVILDMEAVERVPPIASSWAENIAWSVGLVYTSFMQKIFRWYVQATGGTPQTYKIYRTKEVLAQRLKRSLGEVPDITADTLKRVSPKVTEYIEWSRNAAQEAALSFVGSAAWAADKASHAFTKRYNAAAQEMYADSTDVLVVYRGIKRVAWDMGIEETSAVLTTFTIFVFICVCIAVVFMILSGIMFFFRNRPQPFWAPRLPQILRGTLLRLLYVAFPSIMVFSMWEWVQQDSAGVIVISVVVFVLTLAVLLLNMWRVLIIALHSQRQYGTREFLLYGDEHTLTKFGWLYTNFDSRFFYFGAIYMVYNFVKALFIAFAQSSGQTQGLALFIIELIMLGLVCWAKPFLSRAISIINIVTHVIMSLNAMFFLFFSNLMYQPLIVNGVMGVVFFVLNAAYTCVLLIYTCVYLILCFTGRNSHAAVNKDHEVNDDRLSFIEEKPGTGLRGATDELTALGEASRADHEPGTTDAPSWFDKVGSEPLVNPFEPPQAPGALRQSMMSQSEDRTRSLSSQSTTLPGTTNLNTGLLGHRFTDSQTNFVSGTSEEPPMIDSDKSNGRGKARKWLPF